MDLVWPLCDVACVASDQVAGALEAFVARVTGERWSSIPISTMVLLARGVLRSAMRRLRNLVLGATGASCRRHRQRDEPTGLGGGWDRERLGCALPIATCLGSAVVDLTREFMRLARSRRQPHAHIELPFNGLYAAARIRVLMALVDVGDCNVGDVADEFVAWLDDDALVHGLGGGPGVGLVAAAEAWKDFSGRALAFAARLGCGDEMEAVIADAEPLFDPLETEGTVSGSRPPRMYAPVPDTEP